jgi:hypothetical protein
LGLFFIFRLSTAGPTGIPGTPRRRAALIKLNRLGCPLTPSAPDLNADTISPGVIRSPVTLVWYTPNTADVHIVLQIIGVGVDVAKYGLHDAVQVSVNSELAAAKPLILSNDKLGWACDFGLKLAYTVARVGGQMGLPTSRNGSAAANRIADH